MSQYIQILFLVITAVALLWFGYTLFFNVGFRALFPGNGHFPWRKGKGKPEIGLPGDPRTCPVCSSRLDDGILVKSVAFPSLNGGKDRMMYIKGCVYCLNGEQDRICPVCGHVLRGDEFLICRMFERNQPFFQRPHVHVLGCSQCRGV